ncbi:MAG TPA: hypothetical protein PLC79_05810, partial [Phycisphaerae bacterium]|nr:hypothetical protein [Phycisphaerae bacterium]
RTSDLAKTHRGVSVAFIECRTTPEEAKLAWIVRSADVPVETETEAGFREMNGAANGNESSLASP